MSVVTGKRISKTCNKCGHDTFVSYDGTVFKCERCHPANQGVTVRSVGALDPNREADTVLARARNRGGSGAGDENIIDGLLHQRTAELTEDRVEGLKQALQIAKEEDRKRRAG